jgi:hypothetical protein
MANTPDLFLIVRPGADERFRLLAQTFSGMPVRVMWDRRYGEHRSRGHAFPSSVAGRKRPGRAQVIGHAREWVIVRESA